MFNPLLVTTPLQFAPYECIITGRHDGELVDFGVDVIGIDPHVYIKRSIIETVATDVLDMVPASTHSKLQSRARQLEAERDRLQAIVDASESIQEAQEALDRELSSTVNDHRKPVAVAE